MDQKLTLGSKVRYGLADLGFALITSAMQFFLLFYYTDVAGINPALAGSALLVGKLTWDAFNDPFFGYWSDRTRSRFGRRRIYMVLGAIPLGLAAWIITTCSYWKQVGIPAVGMSTFGVAGVITIFLESASIQPPTEFGYIVVAAPILLLGMGVYLLLPARSSA